MKKAAIIQSAYIPWRGYFDIIHDVDVFVFLDSVQLTKQDWRVRNRIKTKTGARWRTVPVVGGLNQTIAEARIVQNDWQRRHLNAFRCEYARAAWFESYAWLLDWLYRRPHQCLSELNQGAIRLICEHLRITTQLVCATQLAPQGDKNERLVDICRKVGANIYLSGPSAKGYLDETVFREAGIEVVYKDYADYPAYSQLHPPFDPFVTVLDLLLTCGPDSSYYIWGHRRKPGNEITTS